MSQLPACPECGGAVYGYMGPLSIREGPGDGAAAGAVRYGLIPCNHEVDTQRWAPIREASPARSDQS